MATAYAALVSLMNVLTRFEHPTCPVSYDQSQLRSMFDKVSSLVEFLEAYSQRISKDLLRKMADAAFAAENMIESYYVDQVLTRLAGNCDGNFDIFCQDLEKAISWMDRIIEEAMGVNERTGEKLQLPSKRRREEPNDSAVLPACGMVKMVGFDEELPRLMDQLTSDRSATRQIIPLVGMAGIGKTTLARNVYERSYIRNLFDARAWVTISQNYTVEKIIRCLLRDMNVDVDESRNSKEELGDRLYKRLFGRRYLIVLDNVWDTLVWGEIRRFFPDNSNRSRIVLTTRLHNVALTVGSCKPHIIKLLDDSQSWDLLCDTVYGQEVCPPELITCGEKIAKSCKGLPMTVVVVGGLLKMSQKTLQHWENVAENVNSFINVEKDAHCLEILSLSYDHLPVHLKPCCLYFATFGEDSKVGVSDLIKLWVADGFLKPDKGRTLEEVGLECLNHLINRNLINRVGDSEPGGHIVECDFHDLFREFCLQEAANELFLYHLKKDMIDVAGRLKSERRLVCHLQKMEISPLPPIPFARSLTYVSDRPIESPLDLLDSAACRLLRVLAGIFIDLELDLTHLVSLPYLACMVKEVDISRFFSTPALLWNLETLDIIRFQNVMLPSEFWELPNLRHVSICGSGSILLPDPTSAQRKFVISHLHTLINIGNFNVTNEVVLKIPRLRVLKMTYDHSFCSDDLSRLSPYFTNLASLDKLERLNCDFHRDMENVTCVFSEPKNLRLPLNLRELVLYRSHIPWEYMNIVGSLPKLKKLRLGSNAFYGEEWNSTEGGFQCLESLGIGCCNLRTWNAESSHFPRLEHLELWELELEEIPLDIGEITPLQAITLSTTKRSAVNSAKEILDERLNQGDDEMLIKVYYQGKPDEERELDDMSSNNFRVKFRVSSH